jgi:hypothetical protein
LHAKRSRRQADDNGGGAQANLCWVAILLRHRQDAAAVRANTLLRCCWASHAGDGEMSDHRSPVVGALSYSCCVHVEQSGKRAMPHEELRIMEVAVHARCRSCIMGSAERVEQCIEPGTEVGEQAPKQFSLTARCLGRREWPTAVSDVWDFVQEGCQTCWIRERCAFVVQRCPECLAGQSIHQHEPVVSRPAVAGRDREPLRHDGVARLQRLYFRRADHLREDAERRAAQLDDGSPARAVRPKDWGNASGRRVEGVEKRPRSLLVEHRSEPWKQWIVSQSPDGHTGVGALEQERAFR